MAEGMVLIVLIAFGICTRASAEDHIPVIAVFTKNFTNPAYENFRIGADKIAAAAGAHTRHYVPKKPDNVDEQTALVAQAIADKPDLVLFIPVDDKAMSGAMERFSDAKLPVVTAVSQIAGDVVTFVSSDDVDVGRREARYLFEKMNGTGKIVILEGIPSSTTSRDRKKGYDEELKKFPGIEVLDSKVANYQRPDAQRAMREMLAKFPQIDGVLAANDVMALGALDVMRERGRTAKVAGVNGLSEAIKRIQDGSMLVTVDFSTFNIACIATQAALRKRDGLSVPRKIMLPAEVIDSGNYEKWQLPTKERSCPAWQDQVGAQ
jgi:ribose transport system substrate-binding protein